ncbi:MAG TPA: hypothetical protein VKS44_08575 [Candidatus Acidoferrales bacterium]|nr:hypothetical protein [Candidatus Acidoferrales bacterium]
MNRAVIDIETIPVQTLGSDLADCEDAVKAASLNALTGRIVCVGMLFMRADYEADSAVAIISNDEKTILEKFWATIEQWRIAGFVAHNGLAFDLPFLWRRSVIHNVKPTVALDLRKYRKDFVFDTMTMWANWDPRNNPSLDALSQSLGLGGKSGGGGNVFSLWKAGQYEDIATYCLHDCWLTYACYCRMNFQTLIAEDQVSRKVIFLGGETHMQEPLRATFA